MPLFTDSERLFQEYLQQQGLDRFEFEPQVQGTTKRPDFRLSLDGEEIYFEVKEFDHPPEMVSGGSFDLYGPIRSKINEAQKQLRPLKGHMCAIVLVNSCHPLVLLEPDIIYGSDAGQSRRHDAARSG